MADSVNLGFTDVNYRDIPPRSGVVDNKPVIDFRARAMRLRALRAATGLAFDPFGELAGISGAAMHKACKTGRLTEKNADTLIASLRRHFPNIKANLPDLMYGAPTERISSEADLDRATLVQIFGNLPPAHRETWHDIGHLLVQRFAPQGSGKPFAMQSLAKTEPR